MVELNQSHANEVMSICLMLCAIVVSIFFGIKLRWFRYRMKMKVPNIEESPVLLRTTTVTEVRENCSIGRYSYIDDNSPGRSSSTTGNYMPQLASSSSFSVKSKNKEQHESIFKWPFKSSLKLKKQQSFDEDLSLRRTANRERCEKDMAMMEKNERLKRSIHEKLYSSASMPDLLQCGEVVKETKFDIKPSAEIRILTGVVVDENTDFVTVDEIKMPKRPVRVKMRRAPSIPIAQEVSINNDESSYSKTEDDIQSTQSPKPPTPPVRRQSRSNSLKLSQIENLSQRMPPLVMPRRHINKTYISIESFDDSNDQEQQNHVVVEQPKSILKTGFDESHAKEVHHITFVNVPDSCSSSEEDEDEFREKDSTENQDDVWTRIDIHRNQLKRLQEMESISHFNLRDSSSQESDVDEIPPLPKTPPPLVDEQPYLRDFSFA